MGDNKEFNDSAIFWGVLLNVGGGKLQNIEDASFVDLGYQMLPLGTSQNMQSFIYILYVLPFSLVWDRTLIVHTSHQSEILHSLIFYLLILIRNLCTPYWLQVSGRYLNYLIHLQ